jgi:hypothetical protein
MAIDMTRVVPWSEFEQHAGDGLKEIEALRQYARDFLLDFRWCGSILEEFVGFAFPGIVAVFLFKISPAKAEVDEWTWVVVGDLPPAYITCEDSPNATCALDAYIGAMTEWVDAAANGRSVDGLIPVDVEPTPESAANLRVRLDLLDHKILANFKDELRAC